MLSTKSNNKTSGIKLVSLYSTIKMMHGPINISYILLVKWNHNNSAGGRLEKKTRSSNDVYVSTIPVARLITFHLYDVITKTKVEEIEFPSMMCHHCEWIVMQVNCLMCVLDLEK